MSDKERQTVKTKRFFVQGTEVLHKQLQHIAIDAGTSAEKLAGAMLELAVERAPADLKSGKLMISKAK